MKILTTWKTAGTPVLLNANLNPILHKWISQHER